MSGLTLTVSDLETYVNERLESDPFLSEVWIEGEVAELHVRGRHAYIQLADRDAILRSIVFDWAEQRLEKVLRPGERVRVRGDVRIFQKNSSLSLRIREAEPVGEGELRARLEELKRKLTEEGCFAPERKRPLPPVPRHIAIVTSAEGAALRDILKVSESRNPTIRRTVYASQVQGEKAPSSIVRALAAASADADVDVIILARGGGSAQDLACFNDERVVHAIVRASHPVVSAVGHETDWTLSDFAADHRAATPSAAAELVVPESAALAERIRQLIASIQARMYQRLREERSRVERELLLLRSQGVGARLAAARSEVKTLYGACRSRIMNLLAELRGELSTQSQRLEALNPSSILAGGYAVVLRDGHRQYNAAQISAGDELELVFTDGSISVKVTSVVSNMTLEGLG